MGPPQRENLLSPVSREYLMSNQFLVPPNKKISCLLSHEKISCSKRKSHVFSVLGSPQKRKYPVSCLMRKSHVSRENFMSFPFWAPPMRRSPVSCLMRKSRVSREIIMPYAFSI